MKFVYIVNLDMENVIHPGMDQRVDLKMDCDVKNHTGGNFYQIMDDFR